MPGYDPNCDPYPHDVDKAKALMKEAGYEAGFDTTLYTDTTDPDPQIGAVDPAGSRRHRDPAKIVSQEFATFLDTIETPHKAPIGWVGWFQDYPDPSDFIDPILSCASAVKGGANAAFYCNKTVDEMAAAAKGETDAAKRTAAYTADPIDDHGRRAVGTLPSPGLLHHHRQAGRRLRDRSRLAV